jgi:hypothetical protein
MGERGDMAVIELEGLVKKPFPSSAFSSKEISPDYIVGLVDGEGYFTIKIREKSYANLGFSIEPCFGIGLSLKKRSNHEVLKKVRDFFGVGSIYKTNSHVSYEVGSLRDIYYIIIPFFEKHPPLIKREEFEVWKSIVKRLWNGEHLKRITLIRNIIPLIERLYALHIKSNGTLMLVKLKESLRVYEEFSTPKLTLWLSSNLKSSTKGEVGGRVKNVVF